MTFHEGDIVIWTSKFPPSRSLIGIVERVSVPGPYGLPDYYFVTVWSSITREFLPRQEWREDWLTRIGTVEAWERGEFDEV